MRRDNSVNCFALIPLVLSHSTKKRSADPKRLNQHRLYKSLKTFTDKPDANTPLKKKIRIVLEGEQSVAEICPGLASQTEGLNTNIYYRWIGPPKR